MNKTLPKIFLFIIIFSIITFFCYIFAGYLNNIHVYNDKLVKNFRITSIRTNSIESLNSLISNEHYYAESDFYLNKDGILISTHDVIMTGNCGNVNEKNLEELKNCKLIDGGHVATLDDFLNYQLKEYYIDLKNTLHGNDEDILKSVKYSIEIIKKTNTTDKAIIMLYKTTDNVVKLINNNNIRAGMKGYPKSYKDTMNLVRSAYNNGFELVCVNVYSLNKDILQESHNLKIWHIGWTSLNDKSDVDHVKYLMLNGLGGIITGDIANAREKLFGKWYLDYLTFKISS